MSLEQAFHDVLRRLAYEAGEEAFLSFDDVSVFDLDVLGGLELLGVLKVTADARVVRCHGCEQMCPMSVDICSGVGSKPTQAFIVCDKDESMGQVNVPLERLRQWQVSGFQIAQLVSGWLGLSEKVTKLNSLWQLGVYRGKKHQAVLGLNLCDEAILMVNDTELSLVELIRFSNGRFELDTAKITQLIDLGLAPAGKVQKNELRKSKTQTRNENWNKEFQRLKLANPAKSDTWISQQIAKLPIADGKDSETIRKNMK